MSEALRDVIEQAWDDRDAIGAATGGEIRTAVDRAIALLDSGQARVAQKGPQGWQVNQWLKKAVLLSFRLNPMAPIAGGPGGAMWWDKVPSKFLGMTETDFAAAGFRAVPGAIVRRGAYVAPGAVLMPSFVRTAANGLRSSVLVRYPPTMLGKRRSLSRCSRVVSCVSTCHLSFCMTPSGSGMR